MGRQRNRHRQLLTARRGLVALFAALLLFAACGGDEPEATTAKDLINSGLTAHADGNLGEAARAYRQALVHEPENKYAYYNLGVIDQAAGRARRAELRYRLALDIDPEFAPALFNLATVLTETKPREAVDVYRQVIKLEPRNAAAYLNLGILLKAFGDSAGADQAFAKAVELDPDLKERVEAGKEAGARSPGGRR